LRSAARWCTMPPFFGAPEGPAFKDSRREAEGSPSKGHHEDLEKHGREHRLYRA
jgi:hypothetical protein